ncbi:MAG: hypothetical protein HN341_01810 [Verrucomicrobia bacterium]|nr:hypothetical protein [Verrucomicrobiota bacterium]
MKGIAHFAVGVASAACFPGAVEAAADGTPLYFVLGGVFGLLPDTLDFKFYRFFYRHHAEVMPDPLNPDPQIVADAITGAIDQAAESGVPFRIRLNTVRLGADLWQRYTVRFNLPEKQVEVEIGPTVDTGGSPVTPAPATPSNASAPLLVPVKLDYMAATNIDIFEGPIFQMTPGTDGTVVPEFIPWHRQWSHSFLVGLMFAFPAWLIWGWLAAAVVATAYAAHVAADQLGYMGSSLLWPLTRRRTPGLKLQHSGEALPNFSAVWLSCLFIFWNVSLASPVEVSAIRLLLWGVVIPFVTIQLLRRKLGSTAR